MKNTMIITEYVKTLNGRTGRIRITFPDGYLSAYGIAGRTIEKTLLENTLPSAQTTVLAVNSALENIGFKGLVMHQAKSAHTNGYVFELREDFGEKNKTLEVLKTLADYLEESHQEHASMEFPKAGSTKRAMDCHIDEEPNCTYCRAISEARNILRGAK